MLVKFLITFIMAVGAYGTISIKFPGTLLILLGTMLYGMVTNFSTFTTPLIIVLISISIIAEVGGRTLRTYLTKGFSVSRDFSVNSAVSHVGGVVASSALFGPVLGLIIWEMLAGKTLLPRSDTIVQVLIRLAGIALVRMLCGMTMILIVHMYIFL